MAIAFVKNVGSVSQGSGLTAVLTVPAAGVALGNMLLVRGTSNGNSRTLTGITDSKGNIYSKLSGNNAPAFGYPVAWWFAAINVALVSGDTITVTYSISSNTATSFEEFSGVASQNNTDDSSDASFSLSTAPTVSLTPSREGLVVAALSIQGTGGIFTDDTATANGDAWHPFGLVAVSNVISLRASYRITTLGGLNTYAPTLGTAANCNVTEAGLKIWTPEVPLSQYSLISRVKV